MTDVDHSGPTEPGPDAGAHPVVGGGASARFVVGLGASAGGLRPLEEFFGAVPTDLGCAFVVVQHLSPDFKSLMQELLARYTRMPVHRVEDGMHLEADAVYLIPPKMDMKIEGDRLRLSEQDRRPEHLPNFPIDVFFESLAAAYGDRAAAVVLSGTGSDGSRGVRAINEAGGVVVVQSPASAQFDGMPRAAIATGLADQVLAPAALAAGLEAYVRGGGAAGAGEIAGARDMVAEVIKVLARDEGTDFTHYKPSTLARRIERRRLIVGRTTLESYIDLLESSPEERDALRNDLLITVTSFFRDPAAWRILERDVMPSVLHRVPEDRPLRIWTAACASGEEAYTMAMIAIEAMERLGSYRDLKVFATDLDGRALEKAAAGQFPPGIEADLGEERLHRYFTFRSGTWSVSRELREKIIFAPHNVIRDAPFTRMNLVSCRNVLIYMQPDLQQHVLRMLHFALDVHGVLFLGAADALGRIESEFTPVDRKWKIYEKRRDVRLPIDGGPEGGLRPATIQPVRSGTEATSSPQREQMLSATISELMSERRAVCVLATRDGRLTQVFGEAEDDLRLPQGAATSEVAKLVIDPLALPISTAFQRLRKDAGPAVYTGLSVEVRGELRTVDVRVSLHPGRVATEEYVSILIEEARSVLDGDTGARFDPDSTAAQRIGDLEHELQQTRENLQATIEELETTNEEQQAGNEELLASNEELQSTNEELHSLNEELYTVNAEYQAKIQELTELHHDMDNLLQSIDIGTVFLDEQLRIRKFTPAATRWVNLVDLDVGRPFSHLSHNIDDPDLLDRLRDVLETGEATEYERPTRDGRAVLVRINPYRTERHRIEGVIAVFIDIDDLKRTQRDLSHRNRELAHANVELDRFNRLAVGREERIVELKEQINRLCRELGRDPAFDLAFLDESPAGAAADAAARDGRDGATTTGDGTGPGT